MANNKPYGATPLSLHHPPAIPVQYINMNKRK